MSQESDDSRNRKNYWLKASDVAYVLCLLAPAYTTDYYGTIQWHLGIEAALLGPIGFFAGHFSWAANPFLWSSWHQLSKENYFEAILNSLIALAIAGTFLYQDKIAVGSAGEFPYVAREGYYLWLVSMLLAIGAAVSASRVKGP